MKLLKQERDKAIVRYRKSGMTMQEIGDMFKITRQRVQQICAEAKK